MRFSPTLIIVAVAAISFGWQSRASAQYPSVPPDVQRAADAKRAAADRRSDEAFEWARPIIEAGEKAGKPYVPGARQPEELVQAEIPAFPGAWGGGMYTAGGRGGKVFVVTNLDDSGPGSFREACEAGGPRIVVFNVAGVIDLKDRIRIRAPYITIAGQTAPGDGVCIAGNTVEIETHDAVVRHMRFRRGNTDVADRNDALGGNPVGNIMIDHVSSSWGADENMSIYRHMYHPPDGAKAQKLPTVNITIQNSISSEALNTYNHSFGSTLGGRNTMFHHNLYACNTGRNPSIGMGGDFNWVNNVLFNWRHRTMDGVGSWTPLNVINNYSKPGPITPLDHPVSYRITQCEGLDRENARVLPSWHVEGNVVEGNERVTADNWAGGVQSMDLDDAERDPEGAKRAAARLPKIRALEPNPMAPVPIDSAEEAFEKVLASAGATMPRRDAVDERLVETVRTGKVTYEQGIITAIDQVGGYPEYRGEPYADADSDGMPDAWEARHGLDPHDPSDAAGDLNGDGYTNIESFIHGIDVTQKVDWTDLENNVDTLEQATKSSS